VGFAESNGARVAVRRRAGTWETLGGLSGAWSVAASIDDDGQIVGTFGTSAGAVHAFLWSNGKTQPLPLSSDPSSAFLRFGRSVAGVMTAADATTHGFFVSRDGKLFDLGTLGGKNSNPFAMNAQGTVVGSSHDEQQRVRAFAWRPGQPLRDLGLPSGAQASEARGVDSKERILGNVVDASGIAHGVFFEATSGEIMNLPLPAAAKGASFVAAHMKGMAADGRAVGTGTLTSAQGSAVHCVLWRPE
jgi:probable HAF family extracellular repeat protein